MKVHQKIILYSSVLFFIGLLVVAVSPVMAYEVLIWDEYVLGTGEEVVSPMLEDGKLDRIVADEVWWWDNTTNLCADAQYYTENSSNSWYWGTPISIAPGGHSFLQIDGQDVDWGPFSNGDTGHTYTHYYTGGGAPITFRIVDWVDANSTNNDCKIRVRIYKSVTVGGYVVDSNPFEAVKLWIISALMLAVVIAVPVIRYRRKTHGRIG